jgi:hypothetical protein
MVLAVSRWPFTVEGPDSRPGLIMWDLCWAKCHWTGFSPSSSIFPCQYIIPPLLHTHLSPPHEMCDTPDHAAHHTVGPKLGTSSLTRQLAGLGAQQYYTLLLKVIYPVTFFTCY